MIGYSRILQIFNKYKKYLRTTEDCSTRIGKGNRYCSPSVYSVYIVFDFRETICGNLWTLRRYLTPQFPLLLKFTYMFLFRDLFCNTAVFVFRCGCFCRRCAQACNIGLPVFSSPLSCALQYYTFYTHRKTQK